MDQGGSSNDKGKKRMIDSEETWRKKQKLNEEENRRIEEENMRIEEENMRIEEEEIRLAIMRSLEDNTEKQGESSKGKERAVEEQVESYKGKGKGRAIEEEAGPSRAPEATHFEGQAGPSRAPEPASSQVQAGPSRAPETTSHQVQAESSRVPERLTINELDDVRLAQIKSLVDRRSANKAEYVRNDLPVFQGEVEKKIRGADLEFENIMLGKVEKSKITEETKAKLEALDQEYKQQQVQVEKDHELAITLLRNKKEQDKADNYEDLRIAKIKAVSEDARTNSFDKQLMEQSVSRIEDAKNSKGLFHTLSEQWDYMHSYFTGANPNKTKENLSIAQNSIDDHNKFIKEVPSDTNSVVSSKSDDASDSGSDVGGGDDGGD